MGQHASLWQQSRLLVQDGAQQVVGVQQALHHHVGPSFAAQRHGLQRSLVGIGRLDVGGMLAKGVEGVAHFLALAHQQCVDHLVFQCLQHGTLRAFVVGAHHCHPLALAAALQVAYHLGEILNCVHIDSIGFCRKVTKKSVNRK